MHEFLYGNKKPAYRQYLLRQKLSQLTVKKYICLNPAKRQKSYFSSGEMSMADYYVMPEHTTLHCKDRKRYLTMRCSEGTGIKLSSIISEAATVYYPEIFCGSKLISDKLRDILLTYCDEKEIICGSIFINKHKTAPVYPSVIWRDLKRAATGSGVSKAEVYSHNLRHRFAGTFMSVCSKIADLADILGHSSIQTTYMKKPDSG